MVTSDKNEIRELLKKLLPGIAALTVICWCVTLFWGFELENLFGFVVGLIYVCFCYIYLGKTCMRAVEMDAVTAKKAMLKCYVIRFGGLFGLCAAAGLTGAASMPCLLLPQFFPKIILMIMQFTERKG